MAFNLQVLGQYVTSLNRMSSDVLCLAFTPENTFRLPWVHRTTTQMAAMGLWRSLVSPCDPGPIPIMLQ